MAPVVPKPDDRIRSELRQAQKDNPAEDDPLVTESTGSNHQSIPRKGRLGGMVWNQCKLGKTNSGVSAEMTTTTLS